MIPVWKIFLSAALLSLSVLSPACAQDPVAPAADHAPLLRSKDRALAANKRLVYDFWRVVIEAGQLGRAADYLAEDYVQHNPNVPSGRDGFVDFFSKFTTATEVQPRIRAPVVSIVAERDLVILSFVQTYPDPTKPGETYTSTWFDMFRVSGGRIVEHWDPAQKQ